MSIQITLQIYRNPCKFNGGCLTGVSWRCGCSREQGSRREQNEEERLLRLFVVVPRALTDSELREHFKQFGDIDYVSIVKDRTTKESKGFGYVKYHRCGSQGVLASMVTV